MTSRSIRFLYRLHKWTGLIAALPLCLILTTGAISVFHDELDAWMTPGRIIPRGNPTASLTQISTILTHSFADSQLYGLAFPARPGVAITAYMSNPSEVFVNPHTGVVSGIRQHESFATFLRTVHVRFNVQLWWARVIVGVFGIALLVSSITGGLIYFPFMRGVFRSGLPFWRLRQSADPQLLWADLHRLLGITSLLFNLLMGTTGVVMGMLPFLRYAPSLDRQMHPSPHRTPPMAGPSISPDAALSIAMRTWPDLTAASLLMPSKSSPRYTIYGDSPGVPMRGAASFLVVHSVTGEVIERYDARNERPFVYAYNWTEPLHYGAYGGLLLKWIYFAFGLCAAALTITGPVIQMLKSRRRPILGS